LKEPLTSDSEGMTLRDYFAAKAMAAMISNPEYAHACTETAVNAYDYADAMLEVRK